VCIVDLGNFQIHETKNVLHSLTVIFCRTNVIDTEINSSTETPSIFQQIDQLENIIDNLLARYEIKINISSPSVIQHIDQPSNKLIHLPTNGATGELY
jgi:hypothetical protein